MSIKNLRKNTQLIKYLQKLRAKKLADVQNFAAPESSTVMKVKQPCVVGKLEKWQFQTRCAPGWESFDADAEERKPICERQDPTSKIPKCRNVDEELSKYFNVAVGDILGALNKEIEDAYGRLLNNFNISRRKQKIPEAERLAIEAKQRTFIPRSSSEGGFDATMSRIVPGISDNEVYKIFNKRSEGSFSNRLLRTLLSKKRVYKRKREIFERFIQLFDEVGEVAAGRQKYIPYNIVKDPSSGKRGERIEEEVALDDLKRIDYTIEYLSESATDVTKPLYEDLGVLLKAHVVKAILADRAKRKMDSKAFDSMGYFKFEGIGKRAVFELEGESVFLRGEGTQKTKSLKDDPSSPLKNFYHMPSEFSKHLESDPNYLKEMDEALYKLSKEQYKFTRNPADLFKSKIDSSTGEERAIGSSMQGMLERINNAINQPGLESSFVKPLQENINSLKDFFNAIDADIKEFDSEARQRLSEEFNDRMIELYKTFHRISAEELKSTGVRTYYDVHSYVTYLAEFHTAVDSLLSEDSEGVLIPNSTNYPLADIHKVVKANATDSMQITFVSTKNGFGSNDSSISAIAAVKFLGKRSYYRFYKHSQKSRKIQVKDLKDDKFTPEGFLEFILAEDNPFGLKLLTSGPGNDYLLPRRNETKDDKPASWKAGGGGSEVVLRTDKNDSLFVRPGTNLSLEEFSEIIKQMSTSNSKDLERLASDLIQADFKDVSKIEALDTILKNTLGADANIKSLANFISQVETKYKGQDFVNLKYFNYAEFGFDILSRNKQDFSLNAAGRISEMVNDDLNKRKMSTPTPRLLNNTWRSVLYGIFPTYTTQEMDIILPMPSDEEISEMELKYTKDQVISELRTLFGSQVSDYFKSDDIYNALRDGAKIYSAFEAISAMNLKYQYANSFEDRTKQLINSLGESKNLTIGEIKAENSEVARYLKDLNSGLNLQEDTILPVLKDTYNEFVDSLSVQEIKDYINIFDTVSASKGRDIAPLGSVGSRLLESVAASLDMFNGDEQVLILSNKMKLSKKDGKPEKIRDIDKHFGACKLKSQHEPDGLLYKTSTDPNLEMSRDELSRYMKQDFYLDLYSLKEFNNYLDSTLSDPKAKLKAKDITTHIDNYIKRVSSGYDSVLMIKSPIDKYSAVTTYNSGKENSSSYASVGVKSSAYGLPAYFAYQLSKGIENPDERKAAELEHYQDTKNKINNLIKKSQEAFKKVIGTYNASEYSEKVKGNSRIIKYYKMLLKKKLDFVEPRSSVAIQHQPIDFADGDIKVIQPCAIKDSNGNIIGASSYERNRACYDGWTSVGDTSGKMQTCLPSKNSTTTLKYPTCPKRGSENSPDEPEGNLFTLVQKEIASGGYSGRYEIEEFLDDLGSEFLERLNTSEDSTEKEKIKEHLDMLQIMQNHIIHGESKRKRDSALRDSQQQLDQLKRMSNLSLMSQSLKRKAEYVVYKYNNVPKPSTAKPTGQFDYVPIETITLEQAVNTGQKYMDWINETVKVPPDKHPGFYITEKLRNDLLSRGTKALKAKGKTPDDYCRFSNFPNPNELEVEKTHQAYIKEVMDSVIKTYGGLIRYEEIGFFSDKTNIRPYAKTNDRSINLGESIIDYRLGSPMRHEQGMENLYNTISHEVGHLLETQSDSLLEASKNFILSRAYNKKPKSLRMLTGNSNYAPSEEAYEGPFIDPYVGKIYEYYSEIYSTEVLSMGLEKLMTARNVSRAFEKDPMHLHYVLGVLLNSYEGQPSEKQFSENNKKSLLLYYKKLIKKKSMDSIEFSEKGVTNFADVNTNVTQPCVVKDSKGNITGVGMYERQRACYNGWTSINDSGGRQTCLPSKQNSGNFSYPTCPREGSSMTDEDATLFSLVRESLSAGSQSKDSLNTSDLLDNIGSELFSRRRMASPEDKKSIDDSLNQLQVLQNEFMHNLSDYKRNMFYDSWNTRFKKLSQVDHLSPEQELERDKAEYMAYKYRKQEAKPKPAEVKKPIIAKPPSPPKRTKGVPHMDDITYSNASKLGKQYMNWIEKNIKDLDKMDRYDRSKKIDKAIREDLRARGLKAMNDRGYDIKNYIGFSRGEPDPKFNDRDDIVNRVLSPKEEEVITELASDIIQNLGGLMYPQKINFVRNRYKDRAYASTTNRSHLHINVGVGIDDPTLFGPNAEPARNRLKAVLAHELGHVLEDQNPWLGAASREYVKAHRTSDKLVPLNKIPELHGGYRDSEEAYLGNYIHPYVGKVYPMDRGYSPTEVISMAVERILVGDGFSNGLDAMFKNSPEHLHFALGAIIASMEHREEDEDDYSEQEPKNKLKKYYRALSKKKKMV